MKRNKKLGKNIQDARMQHGYSLQDVATQCKISKSTLWEIENGANPSFFLVVDIAKYLDKTLDQLFSK